MPTLQLFISIIILTEFRVVCFACKTISGECNLKRPVVSHLPVRFLQTLLFLVAALLRFFSVLFGRGSGNLEGNVKGPLCKVREKCHSHHTVFGSTLTFTCIDLQMQLSPTAASMNKRCRRDSICHVINRVLISFWGPALREVPCPFMHTLLIYILAYLLIQSHNSSSPAWSATDTIKHSLRRDKPHCDSTGIYLPHLTCTYP